MKNGRFICKLVLFTAILALLLSLAACAMADECTESQHVGPIVVTTYKASTCTVDGVQRKTCQNCGKVVAEEPIIAQGHPMGNVTNHISLATCTTNGLDQVVRKCSVCGYVESTTDVSLAALGHDWGDWTVTKQATCTDGGTKQRVCKRDSSHVDTGTIDALGHLWGPQVTTASTCTTKGSVKQVCQRDSSHVQTLSTLPIDPDAHDWGPYVTTKKPNCTEKGVETSTCKLNSAHTRTRDLPIVPDAHVWDNGTVTKKPTVVEEGEKKYVCTLNPNHTKTETLDTLLMKNNTVCAFGPRLRDTNLYPYDTDAWYMFTPFDASKDGKQTYDLVASNTYVVGTVTLTIKDGNLKIDYSLRDSKKFKITLEFFTVLSRINDLTQYEPEELQSMGMKRGESINLEENFGDDTNLVLYFCSRCDFSYSNKISFLTYNSSANQRLLESMRSLMD